MDVTGIELNGCGCSARMTSGCSTLRTDPRQRSLHASRLSMSARPHYVTSYGRFRTTKPEEGSPLCPPREPYPANDPELAKSRARGRRLMLAAAGSAPGRFVNLDPSQAGHSVRHSA